MKVPLGTSSQPPASNQSSIRASEAGARAASTLRSRIPAGLAYLLAVALTAATVLLRLALSSRFGDDPALELFLIPIILSAFAGGPGPGLVSTALAAIGAEYFLLPPKHSFAIESGLHSLEWLVLILAGTLISVLLRKSSRGSPGAAAGSLGNERPGMSPGSEAGISHTLLVSGGSICVVLGALTLVGWFFYIPALTRVGPSFNPMVANTAVGLFLDGLGLLFLAAGRPKAALGGAVWSLLAGILTLAEFGFSIDLHIDELLVRDYLRALPAAPGRIAPNAAVCLVFCGAALLWASMPRWREKAAVIGVLGALVFALGAAAVSGYLIGLPMYAWGTWKPMAANAGLGFVAMGLGVMALAVHRSQPTPAPEERILQWVEWKVRVGFALALAVLIVVGGMSYFSLVRLHEDRVWVDHTYQVIASLRRVLSTVTDAEASARGYIISGKEEFLEPYQEAVREANAELGTLRSLTASNAAQHGRLDVLASLVTERFAVLEQAVEVRRGEGFAAVQQKVPSGREKQLQDRIRGILAEMEASEQSLLQERIARSHHAGTVARVAIIAGITLAFALVAVALFVISGDFAGSRRARAALQEARDQLETRVRERTAELAKAKEAALGSEARLAGVINSAMDAIITVDEQQRILLFNPAAEKMFGCRAGDAIGQSLDPFIPERFRSAHAQHYRAFSEAGITQREMGRLGSICGRRASGEEFPLEAAISRVEVGGRKLSTAILRDITERVAAEEVLRSSEARFRSLIENSADVVVVLDADAKALYVSPSVAHMLGYRPEEIAGHNALDLVHPNEHEPYMALMQSLPKDARPVRSRFRMRHKDGSWRIVESARSNQLNNPDVRGVVVNARDITEFVSAEETLRRQAALFNQTYDAVMVWNWRGPITFWNRGAERLYGYSLGEVIGKNPHQLLRTETPGGVEGFLSVLEQKNTWEGELQHVTRDGRKIIVESRMTLVQDKDQVCALEANRDITERKRVQEKLVEAHRTTTTILESISDGFNTFDREWCYTYANAAAAKMLGKPREELLGKNVWEMWPHAADSPFGVAYRRAVAENVPLQVEAFYPEPLNAWFEVRCYPSPEGLALFFTDTTQRKRAEEEIRLLNRDLERRVAERTAELQAANKELESFSYSVSHDLRAPLRTLDGFSDALLEDYGPQLPAEARNQLATIRRGAQRMGVLIDDLLAFARLGRQPVTRQPVNMEALVRSALEELGPECNGNRIQFVNGDLPRAQGDPALLKQVWINLLSNAIKYSRHAERARIEIGSLAGSPPRVYFVRDNGAGFDMKYASKLFGVFQRLHRADEFEGTGIGLAIVQRVVQRHGGRVWAEAELNQGATFYFTLEGED